MLYAVVFIIGAIIGGAGVFILTRKKIPGLPKETQPAPTQTPSVPPTTAIPGAPVTAPTQPPATMPGIVTPPSNPNVPPAPTTPTQSSPTTPPTGGGLPRL